MLGTMLL